MDATRQSMTAASRSRLPSMSAREAPEALWLGLALALLATLPFLLVRYPQMTDYPAHLARYHVMLDLDHSAWLQRYYTFHWALNGNLGVDLLMVPLGRLFGVETAGWLVGAIIPPLTGLGIVATEWALRRRIGVGALLALVTIWSPALELGFYNFCLSLGLALLAFALWVRLDSSRWRPRLFVPIGFLVWICHVSGWGILGVMVFGYEWGRNKSITAFIAPWPLLAPLLPMLLFPGASAGAMPYGPNFLPYKRAIFQQAMRDQWFKLDQITPWLLIVPALCAMVFHRFDGRVGWAALMMFVLIWAVPRHLGGGDYADYRLIPVTLMLACLAIDWQPPRLALWIAPLLFLFRLGVTTDAWIDNDDALKAQLKALDLIPEGARVAGAVGIPATWPLKPYEHVPAYATVRKDALVNVHFAIPGVHMLQLREPNPVFIDPYHRIIYRPRNQVDLSHFAPAAFADYLWYIGGRQPIALPEGAVVLYKTRHSLLARLANLPAGR